MKAKDALKLALSTTQGLLPMYLDGLADEDLLIKPVPGANHAAWQLGHLISSERVLLVTELPGASYPDLPPGLAGEYSGKSAGVTPPGGYLKKADYLSWFEKIRNSSIANVERMNDADFDRPNTGPMAAFAPTLGALIILVANHTLMHAGQFSVLRRLLGKPVLF